MSAFLCRPSLAGFFAFAALAAFTAGPAGADSISMPISGWSNPPVGYIDFCRHFADQCVVHGSDVAERLSTTHWRDLQEVNTLVNHTVIPVTDLQYYHREEVWTLPTSYGDCEDYALLKRKWLVDRGWPTGSLLITVVFDEVGEGHAVLIARTSDGDFVLDNKTDKVKRWYETAYRYVKRQSIDDPNRWVSVGDTRWSTPSTATSH